MTTEQVTEGQLKTSTSTRAGKYLTFSLAQEAYGLEIISMHWEPEEDLTDEQWEEFTNLVQDTHTKMMLWEGEPTPATRQKLVERGFQVVVFSPCANVPEEGDFMTVMGENIKNLEASFASR